MSVLKRNRKASQFEVFHHLNKLRRDITDLLLRDFGYSFEKAEKRLERRFSGRSYEELTEMEKGVYDRLKKRWEAFDEWFIEDQRKIIVDCLSIGDSYRPNTPSPTLDESFRKSIRSVSPVCAGK